MTETSLGSSFSWWVGKVVNVVDDPYMSGRVRVRIFGRHDDEGSFPDDSLPWAMPLQPITSAAIGRIGTSPLGLLPGSRVLGMWTDRDQQYPIILGSFGKAGDPDGGPVSDGAISVDPNKGGSMPSYSQSDAIKDFNAYSLLFLGGVALTEKLYKQGADESVSNDKGSTITKDVKQKLHKPDNPTTASVDPKDKGSVLDHITQVDPSSVSSSIKNAVKNLLPVAAMLSIKSPAGISGLLHGSMLKGLTSLAGSFGIGPVLNVLSDSIGSINILPPGTFPAGSRNILMGVFAGIMTATASNGGRPQQVQKPAASVSTDTSPKPPTEKIVSVAPTGYIKQYYAHGIDPWPGYIVWKSKDGTDEVYTLRNGEPNWSSSNEELTYQHSDHASTGFGNIIAAGLTGAAAGLAVGALMNSMQSSIKNNALSSILGSGINMGSIMSLAPSLLGSLGGSSLSVFSKIPTTVLSGGFGNAMTKFVANQAFLKMQKGMLDSIHKNSDEEDDLLAIASAGLLIASLLQSGQGSSSTQIRVPLANGQVQTIGTNNQIATTTTTTSLFVANSGILYAG